MLRGTKMKAKAPQGKDTTKPTEYLCIWCDASFKHQEGKELICPSCLNKNDLVPIYMENNAQEQSMLTSNDFHGG
jgi:hypothetical protein